MMASVVPAVATPHVRPRWRPSGLVLATAAFAAALVGVFGRIIAFPLRHDEQMYLPVATMLSRGRLYADYGFNNLPDLPLLMHGVLRLTGTDHVLLAGRLTIFVGWLVAAAAMVLLVRRLTRSWPLALLGALLLVTNPLLLGPAGMIVTNNFLPLAFVLLAVGLLIDGADRPMPQPVTIAAAGLCLGIAAGFKANYIFALPPFGLAVLLAPARLPLAVRMRRVALPFAVGALAGALPPLIQLLIDPAGFVTHVLGYHSGPHVAYWNDHRDLDGEKVFGIAAKLGLAARVWLINPLGLVIAASAIAAAVGRRRDDEAQWPLRLVVGLLAGAIVVSFVPSPAFPQYYTPPVPFAIVLALALAARTSGPTRSMVLLLLATAVLLSAPRIALGWRDTVQPARWTGVVAHRQGERLAALVRRKGRVGTIATLAPLYAVEGGLTVLPAFATGPLVYRVGDYIPPRDRRHYAHLVSPLTVGALLAAERPDAILTGFEGALDEPLAAFARSNGYRAITLPWLRDRYGIGTVYLAPRSSISS